MDLRDQDKSRDCYRSQPGRVANQRASPASQWATRNRRYISAAPRCSPETQSGMYAGTPPQMGCGLPTRARRAALSGRSDREFKIKRSSRVSARRFTSSGYELPSFVAIIIHLPLLRRAFDRTNCQSACLRFLANEADGSRRTCTTTGSRDSCLLQAKKKPSKRTMIINDGFILFVKWPATSTSAAGPPVL